VAEVARLSAANGIISVVSFITPTRSIRDMIRTIVGNGDYTEIFVNAPIDICEQRDTKGLYKQVREGKIREFTGIDSPFEMPENPALEINTGVLDVQQSSIRLLEFVLPLIEYKEL